MTITCLVYHFLLNISEVKEVSHSEELVLNTVSTLNNLSFYNDAESIVQQRQVQITESKPTITIFVLKNNIQLLDEVFVISRIIKVEVSVISRSPRLRLITLLN